MKFALCGQEVMEEESGVQDSSYGLLCWKVWAQGFGSGLIGIARYGAMYWTPLIVLSIIGGDTDESHSAKKADVIHRSSSCYVEC